MKRSHGDGGIDTRGENVHRLRYRINGRRFTKTVRGSVTDARKELRALIRSGDTGDHVAPDKVKLETWIDQWIAAGAPGRRKKRVGQRTLERYEELLKVHVKPKLGARPCRNSKRPRSTSSTVNWNQRSRPERCITCIRFSIRAFRPRNAKGFLWQVR
jgi:hypothetical protein